MAKSKSKSSNTTLVILAALGVLGAWGFFSLTTQVESTLQVAGYKNIQVGPYAMWACTGPTIWASSFEATQGGRHVEGAVCCSAPATCTVRNY